MRFYIKNAENEMAGIRLLAPDLGIVLTAEAEADVVLTVTERADRAVTVTLCGNRAEIAYGEGKARFFRGLATLVGWLKDGITEKSVTEHPLFATNGAMVDMSRNAVMRVDTVKAMLRKMAMMGMNTYMLYTEDTYEVEGYPYFGHMRGRYTKSELRELDAYALTLGIELIPCVQMLGHLATHLRWDAAKPYTDTKEVMLVGADATYELIEAMLKSITDCFTSRRIHIGMDETYDLGRGKYLDKNGYKDRQDIYFAHLARVIEMVRAHGLEPMMWSDMFFRMAGKDLQGYKDYDVRVEFTDEVIAKVPRGVQQVFWDYYNAEESFYTVNLDKHDRVFGKGSLFAGGVWCWGGHSPLFSRSLKFTVPALEVCRKKGVQEVIATVWHNGAECSLILGLLGLAWYADYDYTGRYDEQSVKTCFRYACDEDYGKIFACECTEYPDGGLVGLTRSILYNDPLIGLVDKHLEGMELAAYYKNATEILRQSTPKNALFAPACDTVLRLSELLERKADFGMRLKAAYDAGDREALAAMAAECDLVVDGLEALRRSHRAAWMAYNKPFGWEVHDIRYGGLKARFETVQERINAYLAGELDRMEELEEARLRLVGKEGDPAINNRFLWMKFQTYITPNVL